MKRNPEGCRECPCITYGSNSRHSCTAGYDQGQQQSRALSFPLWQQSAALAMFLNRELHHCSLNTGIPQRKTITKQRVWRSQQRCTSQWDQFFSQVYFHALSMSSREAQRSARHFPLSAVVAPIPQYLGSWGMASASKVEVTSAMHSRVLPRTFFSSFFSGAISFTAVLRTGMKGSRFPAPKFLHRSFRVYSAVCLLIACSSSASFFLCCTMSRRTGTSFRKRWTWRGSQNNQ